MLINLDSTDACLAPAATAAAAFFAAAGIVIHQLTGETTCSTFQMG